MEIPKRLYHGTSFVFASKIMKKGIVPRHGQTSNWKNAPSRRDMVYLTTAYPFYFSNCIRGKDEECFDGYTNCLNCNGSGVGMVTDYDKLIDKILSQPQDNKLVEALEKIRELAREAKTDSIYEKTVALDDIIITASESLTTKEPTKNK